MLKSLYARKDFPDKLRCIRCFDPEENSRLVFLTNNFTLPALMTDQQERLLRIVKWQRQAGLFTQPKLPCLAAYHALNLTAGCPDECRYCYAQSYAHHPGWRTVAFCANLLSRLRKEWPKMRTRPKLVYFSTACCR